MTASNYFDSGKALNISGVLVILIIGSLAVYTESATERWPLIAIAVAGVLSTFVSFLILQSSAQRHSLFWLMAACIAALFFMVRLEAIAILTIVWIVMAAELYGPRRAALLAFASILIFLLSQFYHGGIANLLNASISAVLYGLLQMFALSVVLRGIRERKLHEETALLNRELIATRELLSQSTAQAERVRIARDLHDILGHHMTALILNLEVAKHSIAADHKKGGGAATLASEEKAQEKVEQALALAKLLLGDIRTAVSELREDDKIDLLISIQRLTEGVPNIAFEVDFSNAPKISSVQLAETLLRCVQEGITNVIRHSGATVCEITMREFENSCVVLIHDNGASGAEIVPGNGLLGMQERLGSLGGTLEWDRSPTGCSLQIILPIGNSSED